MDEHNRKPLFTIISTVIMDWDNATSCPYCQFRPQKPDSSQGRASLNRHLKTQADKDPSERGLHPGKDDPRHEQFLKDRKCFSAPKSEQEKEDRRAVSKHNSYLKSKWEKAERVVPIDSRIQKAVELLR